MGSIPARAGEPSAFSGNTAGSTVYPRACGGTRDHDFLVVNTAGLSPRVRGNRIPSLGQRRKWRSIPARAGEPAGNSRWRRPNGVYPRACGGTASGSGSCRAVMGLSPRVRGNLLSIRGDRYFLRSIPARAGEPHSAYHLCLQRTVYPRACGGTGTVMITWPEDQGLSPRVRGNLPSKQVASRSIRSIPARAGEPGSIMPRQPG